MDLFKTLGQPDTPSAIRQAVRAIMYKEYWSTRPDIDDIAEQLTCVMDIADTPRKAFNYSVYSCWGGELDHPLYERWSGDTDYLELIPRKGKPVCFNYRDIKPYVEQVWNEYKMLQHQGRMEI